MASTYEPEFTGDTVAPSSADASYHPVAIQLYGHASKFNGTTTNHVRDDLRPRLSLELKEVSPVKAVQSPHVSASKSACAGFLTCQEYL